MKKVVYLTVLFSLFGWSYVNAETTEMSEDRAEVTSNSVVNDLTSANPVSEEESMTSESSEELDAINEKDSAIIDLGTILVPVKKNQKLTTQDFYNYLDDTEKVIERGIKEFQFVDNQIPSTDVIGQFPNSVKLTGVDKDGITKTILAGYVVSNDVATIKLTDVTYDDEKRAIVGTTDPKAWVTYHGEIDKGYGQGHVIANEKGYFEIGGIEEVGTKWFLRAYDDMSSQVNYSDEVEFTIPGKTLTSSENSSSEPDKSKENKKNILPQTGVRINNVVIAVGVILLATAGLFYCERRFNLF